MILTAGNVWTYLDGDLTKIGVLDYVTSYRVHGRWFAKAYRKGHWDGITRFREFDRRKQRYRFPTGFLERVTAALDEKGVYYELIDERIFVTEDPVFELRAPDLPTGRLELRDYQRDALERMLLYGRGTVKLPTGAGKTEVAAAAIKSLGRRSLFLTHRRTLLHQTQKRLTDRLGCRVGILGDSQCDLQNVTVGMVQTLAKRKENVDVASWLSGVEVLVGDEVHHLEADQWYETFAAIDAPFRFGMTATPCTDGAGMRIIAMTGGIIAEVGIQTLIQQGVLVPPRIWFIKITGPRLPKSAPYATVYKRGVTDNIQRNEMVVHAGQTFAAEEKPAITLVKRLKHGRSLVEQFQYKKVDCAFIHGKVKESDRLHLLDDLWAGRLKHIVAMEPVMGEGVDIPELRALINATGSRGGGSKTNDVEHQVGRGTIQILGRGLRRAPGKTHFDYVDFSDQHHAFLAAATKDRLSTLLSEGYADGSDVRFWRSYAEASVA